jgi:hypothetical protein
MRRKSMFKILLITPFCPSVLSNIWTRPSCISPPHPRTSYKESNPIKFETKNNLEPYLIFCQSLNLLHMSFEIQILNDTKSPPLDKTNIYLGTLSNAWSKTTRYFQNFESLFLWTFSQTPYGQINSWNWLRTTLCISQQWFWDYGGIHNGHFEFVMNSWVLQVGIRATLTLGNPS